MNNNHYTPSADNVSANAKSQGIDFTKDIDGQKATPYPATDALQNATINDNYIYLSTTDNQHRCYKDGRKAFESDYTSFSGYFTSEDTAKKHINADGSFDAYGFHRDVCVAPTEFATDSHILMDKRHLDCFYIDRDRMEQIYGTRDFNAAIGKCNANNQYGSDGGDQGFNPYLTDLYNSGCLKYVGTYDADPPSTTKFLDDYNLMEKARDGKCRAILSSQSAEDVQKIGFPLDPQCHEQTAFDAKIHNDLNASYKNFQPRYNEELATSTDKDDRTIKGLSKTNAESNGSTQNTSPCSADVLCPNPPEKSNNLSYAESLLGSTSGPFGNANSKENDACTTDKLGMTGSGASNAGQTSGAHHAQWSGM